MKVYFISMVMGIFFIPLSAQENQVLKGYGLLAGKAYQEAIESFELALDNGQASVEIYYNLANAYLGQDSIGKAILYFEKALKLDPHNADVKNNLNITKSRMVEPLTELDAFFLFAFWKDVANIFTANTWAYLSILLAISMLLVVYFYGYGGWRPRKRWLALLVSLQLMIFAISIIAGIQKNQSVVKSNEGIVMVTSYLKSGPDQRSDDLKALHPGYKVSIIDELDGWYKVRTVDREEGWLLPGWIELI